jgi:hypothetical protein
MCVATTKNKIQAKMNDEESVCVFVGYAVNHADDIYRLLNPTRSLLGQEMSYGWIKVMGPGLNQRMTQVFVMIQTVKSKI